MPVRTPHHQSREQHPLTFCRSTFPTAYLSCGRTLLVLLAVLSAALRAVFAVFQKPPLPHHGRKRAVFVFAGFLLLTGGNARAQGIEACPGGGDPPVPVEVAVTAVPIVVTSTTDDYFVLYVQHELDVDITVEVPVAVTLGEAGTTTLAENVAAMPVERYRVEKYLIADPADVDGDCIDDITELEDPVGMNPVNAAMEFSDGAVAVPDRQTFERLSYQGTRIDTYLADLEVVKFVLVGLDEKRYYVHADLPRVYFQNTETHQLHSEFANAIGLSHIEPFLRFYGSIVYHPRVVAPDGSLGVYSVRLWSSFFSCSHVDLAYTALAASMPLLEDNLVFYVPPIALPNYQDELACYEASRIPLAFDATISPETGTGFLALNPGGGYGLLRVMELDARPRPRDVVIYEALPNELPRVAGIISTVPQTPLSHVNLRAAQDGIPNAYIRDVLDDPDIAPLLGGFVRYEVTATGYTLRAATPEEVEVHYESSRPSRAQTPEFDLSVTGIKPLSQIGFEDWKAFGVKAANVAVLGTLGFPAGTVPDGFAIPFYFYDEFMKAQDFYTRIETMLANEDFQTDFETQDDMLDDLRDDIKDAETPEWIKEAAMRWGRGGLPWPWKWTPATASSSPCRHR